MNLLSPPYLRRSVRLEEVATYVPAGEPSFMDDNSALQAHNGYQNPTVLANLLAPPHLRRSVRLGEGAVSLLPVHSADVAESGRGDALPGTAGIKISAQGPPFLVEGEAILMDEQGALQGQFGYRNPTVQAKDVLVAVNGQDVEELEIAAPGSLHAALKGPRASLVQLTFVSAATGGKFDVRVRRHAIQQLHQAVTSEQEQATSGGAGYDAGIIIGRPDLQNDEHPVLVVALAPGSNADLCGEVDVGDELLAVDSSDCFGKPINAIAAQLVGLKGSTVTLRLRKPDEISERLMNLKREPYRSQAIDNDSLGRRFTERPSSLTDRPEKSSDAQVADFSSPKAFKLDPAGRFDIRSIPCVAPHIDVSGAATPLSHPPMQPQSSKRSPEEAPLPDTSMPNADNAWCKVLASYTPQYPDELSLIKGQLIELGLEPMEPGWYRGKTLSGKEGLVPITHVRVLLDSVSGTSLDVDRLVKKHGEQIKNARESALGARRRNTVDVRKERIPGRAQEDIGSQGLTLEVKEEEEEQNQAIKDAKRAHPRPEQEQEGQATCRPSLQNLGQPTDSADNLTHHLRHFYSIYAPEKVENAQTVAMIYGGKLACLNQVLAQRYNAYLHPDGQGIEIVGREALANQRVSPTSFTSSTLFPQPLAGPGVTSPKARQTKQSTNLSSADTFSGPHSNLSSADTVSGTYADSLGKGQTPMMVAKELQRQVADQSSVFKKGLTVLSDVSSDSNKAFSCKANEEEARGYRAAETVTIPLSLSLSLCLSPPFSSLPKKDSERARGKQQYSMNPYLLSAEIENSPHTLHPHAVEHRMMCRSPRGASLYSDNSLQTYDASMQGQGQIQNEECEGACSEISRTTHMLDEIKFFGGQNSRTLSTPIYPTCNLKPHRRRIFEETRAPASPPANRSKSVPSVIAVKRLTPKVLQRIAHAPFAADENGVMSHVTRDGGQKNEDGQRDKGLGGGGLNQSRGVLGLARERERWVRGRWIAEMKDGHVLKLKPANTNLPGRQVGIVD